MILIIHNPVSGGTRAKQTFVLFSEFAKQSQLNYTAYQTKMSKDYAGIKSEFETIKPQMVISCGGDGTANDVVNALYLPEHNNSVPLLVLPAGSGNDFSTQLYGKKEAKELFNLVKDIKIRHVDLGICNQSLFLNGVGIGFDGAIAQNTSSNKKSILPTSLKYYIAILKQIFSYKEFDYYNALNKKSRKGFIVAIANGNSYGGGFKIAPKALLDDGLLDVVEIGEVSPMNRPFYIPKVEKGKHLNLSFVRHHQIQQIEIISTSKLKLPAHADGEFFEATQFKIEVLPAALPVMV